MGATDEIVPLFAAGKTCVFWNVEDYPIPDGHDPASLHGNIKEAIKKQGCHEEVSIKAYVDKLSDDMRRKYDAAGFILKFVPEDGKEGRIYNMFFDITLWAIDNPQTTNVIILAKNIGDEMGYHLWRLHRYHRLLLSQTEPEWGHPSASSICFLTSLFDGLSGTSQRLDSKKQKISSQHLEIKKQKICSQRLEDKIQGGVHVL